MNDQAQQQPYEPPSPAQERAQERWAAPPPVTTRGRGSQAASVALSVAKWTGLALLWTFQYAVAVWCILAWRFCVAALKFGAWGLLMLCIPIIGWIILAVKIYQVMTHSPRPARRSVWKPWGLR